MPEVWDYNVFTLAEILWGERRNFKSGSFRIVDIKDTPLRRKKLGGERMGAQHYRSSTEESILSLRE